MTTFAKRLRQLAIGGGALVVALGLGSVPPASAAPPPVCDDKPAPPPSSPTHTDGLVFGIYAGGNDDDPTAPPDDPVKIKGSLETLQDGREPFVVSGRVIFDGSSAVGVEVPANLSGYAGHGRRLDVALVLGPNDDLGAWERFVRANVRRFGPFARSIQIGHEENFGLGGGTDPGITAEAIVRGVHAAKAELRTQRRTGVLIGINAGVDPDVDVRQFFQALGEHGGRRFARAVDYVGLDVYPGLPTPLPTYRQAMADTLHRARRCWLPTAGIPASTPIHVTENGWPTTANELCVGQVCYPRRTDAEQATALDEMVRTVSDYRATYHVTTYQWFGLRDHDSSVDIVWWHGIPLPAQFGIVRDDYHPKPAFHTYRELIAEFGTDCP